MMRAILGLIVVGALIVGGLYVAAGRGAPPSITIDQPERLVGQLGALQITAGAPGSRLKTLTIGLDQGGHIVPLFSLDAPQAGTVSQPDPDHLRITRPFGKQGVPELQAGPARIVVTASRASFLGLRTLSASASKAIEVRLEPPRIAVLSTHHYVNHGGSEMVVYRATPPDVASGVRVGDIEYRRYTASDAGSTVADPAVKVAFFALLHDQDLNTPIVAFARDETGNEATTPFVDNVFEKRFKKSRIEVDDRFFSRVVPDIVEHSPELKMTAPIGDLLPAFLRVNGELRRSNADFIASIAAKSSTARLWDGSFVQLGNSQVEAGFADYRTYVYNGKDVDQQVHLGFDLAVTANTPVLAANAGIVMQASWLGIYGNCIILDHGMGVLSLYGHLSSFDVKVGDKVARGQLIGKTGMTGLAGGDHLHFTMLVGGHPVNPVEWWDSHWIQDRVDRKLHETSGGVAQAAPAPAPAPSPVGARPRRRRISAR